MGESGFSGFSGYSGFSAYSGNSGYSGASGVEGYSGLSGRSGYSGPSGFSGAFSGTSGFSGYSGKSGASGVSGFSGKSGCSGYSGYSGKSGASGPSGQSGYSGYSGRSGRSGQSGASGFSGGYSGFSGFSGYSSQSGISGFSGYSGDGISGASGVSGFSGGFSGKSGYSGISAASGFSGSSGYSGFSGTFSGGSGFSGSSGATGTSGFSGTSGYSGLSGTSGFSGTFSGFSGFSGTSANSGLSGFSGFSGTHSGQSGTSGTSGYSGYASGLSGFSAYSGSSGFSSASGISGYSGISGFSGMSGSPGLNSPSNGNDYNLLVNGLFDVWDKVRGTESTGLLTGPGSYSAANRWATMASTSGNVIKTARITGNSYAYGATVTNMSGGSNKIGFLQIVEETAAMPEKGRTVTLAFNAKGSSSYNLRMAVLMSFRDISNPANLILSSNGAEVVNDWSSGVYTPLNFFGSDMAVVGTVGTAAVTTAWASYTHTVTIPNSNFVNLIAFVWTESNVADATSFSLEGCGLTRNTTGTFSPRHLAAEQNLARSFYTTMPNAASEFIGSGIATASTTLSVMIDLQSEMRNGANTLTIETLGTLGLSTFDGTNTLAATGAMTAQLTNAGRKFCIVRFTADTWGLTVGKMYFLKITSGSIGFIAEIL